MRHQVPDGDLGKLLGRAISVLLAQVRRRKFAERAASRTPKPPTPNPSRTIPVAGITLRCRAHNQRQAERDFGARHMARFRKQASPRGTGFESSS
jgi:hypothetical protein